MQIFALEPVFNEDILEKALAHVRHLETRVAMPPAAVHNLEQLIDQSLAVRKQAMPAEGSLRLSVETALVLELPGVRRLCYSCQPCY